MKKSLKPIVLASTLLLVTGLAIAKLPAPSDEAKAKAAEAAAKTAWAGKVDAYTLCKAQDKVAARSKKSSAPEKDAKPASKAAKPAVAASGCVDPGPFVYTPVVAAAPLTAVSAPAAAGPAAKKP